MCRTCKSLSVVFGDFGDGIVQVCFSGIWYFADWTGLDWISKTQTGKVTAPGVTPCVMES